MPTPEQEATAPPNPPRSPDEPCTELPCHHARKKLPRPALPPTVRRSPRRPPKMSAPPPPSTTTPPPSPPPPSPPPPPPPIPPWRSATRRLTRPHLSRRPAHPARSTPGC